MTKKALFLEITYRTRLDILANVHSTELFGLMDILQSMYDEPIEFYEMVHTEEIWYASSWPNKVLLGSAGWKKQMQDFDIVVMPPQTCPQDLRTDWLKQRYQRNLEIYEQLVQPLQADFYYMLQDMRDKYDVTLNIVDPGKQWTVLTSFEPENALYKGRKAINSDFARKSGKYIHGPLFKFTKLDKAKHQIGTAIFQIDEYRAGIFEKYGRNNGLVGIGETEPTIPSITNNQIVNYHTMRYHLDSCIAVLVTYSELHVKLKAWYTPRLFQALAWGQLPIVPCEYQEAIAGLPIEEYVLVTGTADVKALLMLYKSNKAFRARLQSACINSFYELSYQSHLRLDRQTKLCL